jgi:hypothetical protein
MNNFNFFKGFKMRYQVTFNEISPVTLYRYFFPVGEVRDNGVTRGGF